MSDPSALRISLAAHPDPVLTYEMRDDVPTVTATNDAFDVVVSVDPGVPVSALFERFDTIKLSGEESLDEQLRAGEAVEILLETADDGQYVAHVLAPDVDGGAIVFSSRDVAFIGESRDNIKIVSQKHATGGVSPQELDTEVQVAENRLEITTDEPQLLGLGGGRVALELRVPRNVAVHRLHTNYGSVTGVRVPDGATLEALGGDVSVTRARGDVSVRSVKGDITVDGTGGNLSARTSDGTIQVRDPASVAALTTKSGNITAEISDVVDEALVESSAGDLLLQLSDELSAALFAHTATGEFSIPDQTPQFRVHRLTKTRLRAAVDSGGTSMTARTDDGDITIRI